MHRPILTSVLLVFASAALSAQQSSPSDSYQGVAAPPPDSSITASQPDETAPAKPHAGKRQAVSTAAQQSAPADTDSTAATDRGTVQEVPEPSNPNLRKREMAEDPDGDIVHPHHYGPGVVASGATIRVRLLTELSTTDTQVGEAFRSKVASDVLQNGEVVIPAGAEIEGRVVEVSSGTPGGHGTLRLRPETVIMADGRRYRMSAMVTGTPGSKTKVTGEGVINAGSRAKKDAFEYGGAVGAGAATGAVMGGPVGALTGGLIGAGAITVHLLINHPQARLEPGTVLLFTLTDSLNLVASANSEPTEQK